MSRLDSLFLKKPADGFDAVLPGGLVVDQDVVAAFQRHEVGVGNARGQRAAQLHGPPGSPGAPPPQGPPACGTEPWPGPRVIEPASSRR